MNRIDYFGTGTDAGDNSFLSNFHEHDGWTVEHYYQAAKTDDPWWVARILLATSPKEAKRLGRQCPIRSTWEDEKGAVMLTLLRIKFSRTVLAEKLLATGDAELIEGNWWHDIEWGVCTGKCKRGPHEPRGENMLGKLLMQVREELRVARDMTATP